MSFAVTLPQHGLFGAWRDAARIAVSHGIAPGMIDWSGAGGLFAGTPLPALPALPGAARVQVPSGFLTLAGTVIWHAAPGRFSLLYEALWRLGIDDGDPLSDADPLGRRLRMMAKSVRRDIHKMHAFVRFRELPAGDDGAGARRRFAAWFEPEHNSLEPGCDFFVKRFFDMDWTIATPHLTALFEDGVLRFGPAAARPQLPEDASEALWATYFANIFNPARLKLDAMRSEMPRKYWKNLPETRLIPDMLKDAEARVARMREAGATLPRPGAAAVSTRYRAGMSQPAAQPQSLDEAKAGALQCRRCHLCEAATQTVWGEGAADAPLMIVGEQPGDHEDLQGRPFVGPAGQLLRTVMAEAGLDAGRVWLTNAVKHFKFEPRGKRRLHRNPDRGEITHCRWWLDLELSLVRPRVTLALGRSAALALTGSGDGLTARRGAVEAGLHGGPVLISWHPAYILRLGDAAEQAEARHALMRDLGAAAALAGCAG